MASDGMFHRGHSQLQLKLRRLQPDLQARVRDWPWPADFQFQQTMFLVVQDTGRGASFSFDSRVQPRSASQFSLSQSRPSAKVVSKILYFIYLIVAR